MLSTVTGLHQVLPTEIENIPSNTGDVYPLYLGNYENTSSLSNMRVSWPVGDYVFPEDNDTETLLIQLEGYKTLSSTNLLTASFKENLRNRLKEFCMLQDGWDGYKALKIDKATQEHALSLMDKVFCLLTANNSIFVNKFEIFPSSKGGFQFEIRIIDKEIEIEYMPNSNNFHVLCINIDDDNEYYQEHEADSNSLPSLIKWLVTLNV